MKYWLLVMLCLFTSLLYAEEAVLIVGSEQNYPPFALGMTDETADGFTVELWQAVAKESYLNYKIRVMPFHDVLQEFKKGKIDVLINLAQSDERKQFADFTVPHVIVNGAIFVRQGDTSIKKETDLNNKKIIVLNADLAHDYALSKGWKEQLVLVDTAEQGFQLLVEGQYDALLLSKLAGKQTLEKLGLKTIEALPIKVGFSQKFCFAVHKGNAELLAKINEGLALTKTSGVYDVLYEKWFGVYEEKSLKPLLIRYLLPMVGFFLLIIGVGWYRRNIERQQVLLALQESETKFRDLFENAPLPYQSLDKTGRLLHINQAWLNLIQPPNEKLIGRFFHEFVSADSKPVLDTMLLDIEKQLAGSLILKLECSDKTRLILIKWQVVKNIKKQFQYIHCILIDITERYEAEQSSKESQATLAAVYDDLVQFTYIAAHHLQEPSRRIVTFAQRLRTQLAEQIQLDEEINTTLTFIEQSATRQKLLVRDIQLYLAAIKPIGRIEQQSLCTILTKVIKHHAELIKATNAKIEYNDLPTVHFDLPRLYDIFKILIDNSLRYRHPDRTPYIKINTETKAGRVYISVTDNGIGIPEDYRERVFFVFERLGTDKLNDSTGIGLSIVRRIIISSHGQVKIQETPNGGTTVLFDLPE